MNMHIMYSVVYRSHFLSAIGARDTRDTRGVNGKAPIIQCRALEILHIHIYAPILQGIPRLSFGKPRSELTVSSNRCGLRFTAALGAVDGSGDDHVFFQAAAPTQLPWRSCHDSGLP